MRSTTVTILILTASATITASATAQGFECQGPPCTYLFPAPRGVLGDCEAVSWNGIGLATVDSANGCGFPTAGSRYLRVRANGPENFAGGTTPGGFTGNAGEVYIPVPSGATAVSFSWDFYCAEMPMSPFNDGMLVDVINAAGAQLAVLGFADTTSPLGACIDASACSSGAPGADLTATPGPEAVANAALPAGAAFIRVAVWNGVDNLFPSAGVADGFSFALPAATYPGTGEDLALLSGIASGPAPSGFPSLSVFPDVKTALAQDVVVLRFVSPAGSLDHLPVFIGFNLLATGAFPPPDPLLVLFGVHLRPGFNLLTFFGFFVPTLLPGGNDYSFATPAGLAGLSLLVQGAVLIPSAANGIVMTTNAHELRFQ